MKFHKSQVASVFIILGSLASSPALAKLDFSNPVMGNEFGVEHQLERIDGEKFVERTFARWQRTFDWQMHKDERGSSFDAEAKIGLQTARIMNVP